MEWLREQIYNNFIADNRWRYLTNGLKVTLEVTFFAVLIGIVLGLLVAVVRSTYAKTGKMKIGSFLCGIYITVIRGTPVVVQLLIIYFVVFGSVKIDKVLVAIAGTPDVRSQLGRPPESPSSIGVILALPARCLRSAGRHEAGPLGPRLVARLRRPTGQRSGDTVRFRLLRTAQIRPRRTISLHRRVLRYVGRPMRRRL